ncbi:polyketide cyclase [Mycobacterium sp. E735]|uniref:polyketide cyclase n=1 Tax=Mycobacterium sp. E735 TaxID=1834148 RepID=UPI0009ED360B|nr:polyketide cyclase [Mycobacterium sp. E735]
MSTVRALYERWITELWAGRVVDETRNMMADLTFAIQLGPFAEGDLVAGRWVGTGRGPDGPVSFTGNDILRRSADGRRFAEYWTGTSAG